jgi:hypothetical protein
MASINGHACGHLQSVVRLVIVETRKQRTKVYVIRAGYIVNAAIFWDRATLYSIWDPTFRRSISHPSLGSKIRQPRKQSAAGGKAEFCLAL